MASIWTRWAALTALSFVLISKVVTGLRGDGISDDEHTGCSAVKYAYETMGFDRVDVPSSTISGEHLKVCPQGFTCCTKEMEDRLNDKSKEDFNQVMADKIGLLRTTFISRTAKFDTFFTELLDNSKVDLHNMFVRTYGLLYQQNSYIFTDLFKDLRSYYKGSDINLLDVMDNFFTRLFEKMFILLNASYKFDDTYMECLTDHMGELKPFKDVPQKLSVKIKRAFIAARTFVQGLAVGRDVVLAVSKIEPSASCLSALMKMQYCSYCRGLPYAKPCNNYCMNVMKGCLAYHAELNQEWNSYIEVLMKLAERLEGSFNIESVVDPIDIKISDAIMNFQEESENINAKVFHGCGRPEPGNQRGKREAAAAAASSYDEYDMFERTKYVKPTTAAGTSLDRLVRDIKEKVETAKDFFKNLPNAVCNDKAAKIFDEGSCWNGLGVNVYMPDVMKDGVMGQLNNPEVDVDVRKPNAIVGQQIIQLKLIINKLRNAYNGVDVDWIDTEVLEDYGSGSGSGSGSGDNQNYDPGNPHSNNNNRNRNNNKNRHHDSNNGISFSNNPTRQPPHIQTYRPYDTNNNHDVEMDMDMYNRNNNSGAALSSCCYLYTLVLPLLVSIVLMLNTRQSGLRGVTCSR